MDHSTGEFTPPRSIKVSIIAGESPVLLLTIDPGGSRADALTQNCLKRILKEYGAEEWLIDQEQVRLLRTEQFSLEAPKGYRIAERRDAEVLVRISEDRREAWMRILGPCGGAPASADRITAELKRAGVSFGILRAKIPELVAVGSCDEILIARASPPIPGTDVAFERLVKEPEQPGHAGVGEDESVDLHNLGRFVSVTKGTPLLKRIPPTPGIPGISLNGKPIPPMKPRDRALILGAGTAIAAEDPNILVATADGLPVISDNSAKVISVLELDGLDYQTGNVEFVGSIIIRGPIQPGFRAKAGGDIVAHDNVDAAELTAGGSIHLSCGVSGRGQSYLSAKGSIKARFLSDCTVYCGGDVEVEDLIANCTVICEGAVEAGQKWGKGQIYGGKVRATRGVCAQTLGSVMEVNTLIEVSSSPSLSARERVVVAEMETLQQRLGELGRSLAYLQHAAAGQTDPRIEPIANEHHSVQERLEALSLELEDLTARLRIPFDAKISAARIYPGVTVSIGVKRETIAEPMENFVYTPTPEATPPSAAEESAGRGLRHAPAKSTG